MEYAFVAVLFFWFVAGAVNVGVSFLHKKKGLDCPPAQLATQYGWAVCVYPVDGTIAMNATFRQNVTNDMDIEVKTIACVALLGILRDNHPDPLVADRAADLIIALKTHTSTVKYEMH